MENNIIIEKIDFKFLSYTSEGYCSLFKLNGISVFVDD